MPWTRRKSPSVLVSASAPCSRRLLYPYRISVLLHVLPRPPSSSPTIASLSHARSPRRYTTYNISTLPLLRSSDDVLFPLGVSFGFSGFCVLSGNLVDCLLCALQTCVRCAVCFAQCWALGLQLACGSCHWLLRPSGVLGDCLAAIRTSNIAPESLDSSAVHRTALPARRPCDVRVHVRRGGAHARRARAADAAAAREARSGCGAARVLGASPAACLDLCCR